MTSTLRPTWRMCSSGSSRGGPRSTGLTSCWPGTGRPHGPPWQPPPDPRWQPHHASLSDERASTSQTGRAAPLAERRRISMDLETAIQAFVSAGNDLPREAMQWALDHWDEVAPELLSVMERYTSGADRSDETASAVFFILHLAGEKQDTRVFPLLCRLAQDGEAIEAALGDGITTTLKRILISTYDGDLDTLKGLIEAAEADQFVRAGALEVLAYLTAIGRIPQDKTQAYLLRLYDRLQPQQENFVWSGWVLAIALLGLEELSDVVRQAFGRGLIEPMVMNYDSFRTDLGRTLADSERMAGFWYDRLGPLEDAI